MARRTASAALLLSISLAPAAAVDRLTVVNSCKRAPIWIAHLANVGVGPGQQNVKIEPGDSYAFSSEDTDGLGGARYWPKMGCDETGSHCTLGDSGGPGEGCVVRAPGTPDDYSRCAPPVDTKFEASFGVSGKPCNPRAPDGSEMAGCDYVDISLVDGFTLPVKLEIYGECNTSSAQERRVGQIDCSGLTMDVCPHNESLTGGRTVDLAAKNPASQQAAGCYSPCMRLLDTKWTRQAATTAEDPAVSPYCCPTPPVSPEQCRTGPITSTKFIDTVKAKCPGAYSYAYDDSNGLLRCTSETTYVLIYYCLQHRAANTTTQRATHGFLQAP